MRGRRRVSPRLPRWRPLIATPRTEVWLRAGIGRGIPDVSPVHAAGFPRSYEVLSVHVVSPAHRVFRRLQPRVRSDIRQRDTGAPRRAGPDPPPETASVRITRHRRRWKSFDRQLLIWPDQARRFASFEAPDSESRLKALIRRRVFNIRSGDVSDHATTIPILHG